MKKSLTVIVVISACSCWAAVVPVLVVNLEHGKEITRTIIGPAAMEEFDPQARDWHPVSNGSRAELTLVAGGGRLLRLQARP